MFRLDIKKQVTTDKIVGARRSLRLNTQVLAENVYRELDEDVYMDTDDDLDQEMQQGHLCVLTDPRRVGGPDGEPTIINIEELRSLMITQQSLEDQTVWLTTAQAGFQLEETWGRTYSNIQITIIVPPKIVPQGKATWEPDPKPLMTNHPPRVTDSNTRITLLESSLQWSLPTG